VIAISFSSDVKSELARDRILSQCCLKAQAYGLVLFGRSFSSRSVSFVTENSDTAAIYADSIHKLTGISVTSEPLKNKTTIKIKTAFERLKLLEFFGHSQNELVLRINRANITEECCFGSFIRGVFFACGTVTSPDKNYHLEFVVPHLRLSSDLIKVLDEMKFSPKHIMRNGYHIVYFKDSEAIEDILTVMGATNSSLEMMGIKMQKNMRNSVNRKVNFELANITRTIEASSVQIEAIEIIESHIGLNALPKHLYEIALLRRDNSEKSLIELGNMLEIPISRSGVNHRLNRIIKIAEELEC